MWNCHLAPEACLNKQVHWLNVEAAAATEPQRHNHVNLLTPQSLLQICFTVCKGVEVCGKCSIWLKRHVLNVGCYHPSHCPLPHPPHQKAIDSISSAWPVTLVHRLWRWCTSFTTNLHTVSKTMSTLPCKGSTSRAPKAELITMTLAESWLSNHGNNLEFSELESKYAFCLALL